jgi:nucleotide sugar dehydrogenase
MLDNYKNAATEIAKKIKKDDLIIQRSTVPVGTARNTLKKILEENSNLKASVDFQLSCAPERTLQGNALKELRELSQIIGGIDERSVKKTSSIFNKITHTIVKVSSLEAAELIKLFDNTYRDITISIANLYGKICQKLNLDAKEVIEAANYGYSRNKILFPGPGVGGGCLVKDPYLLLSSLQQTNLDLIKKSREINDSMITDTINLIKSSFEKTSKIIKNSKIFVLGFAFKGTPATDDIRFSPTLPIVDFLKKEGAIIYGYDGVVKPEDIKGLGVERISQIYEKKNYDCIILMNNNQEFRGIDFKKLNEGSKPLLIIDGWYMYDSKILDRLGIKYFALGAKNE